MGNQKRKKPVCQLLDLSKDNDVKKKNLTCNYCKKKGHFKVNCWKFKAEQRSNDSTNTKKGQGSKEETAKLAVDKETVINLFMAWEGTLDFADSWIIDSGTTSPIMVSRRPVKFWLNK